MRLFFVLVFFLSARVLFAQFHEPVFPGLNGQELLDALATTYKPLSLVNNFTNDTLYKEIYLEPGDSLRCIYTGYTVYLPPGLDPSQAAFSENINMEHTYPKAMGAETGLAADDMHHLFPSRADVNNARGNLPFGEVNDPDADQWFYLDQTLSNVPGTHIDLYSEVHNNDLFEPREDHKGNVARAMFYFYTMYKAQADLANNTFFEAQRETLCQWHYADPVDSLEWVRTFRIAGYQEGKPNPFVLDCTLPQRSYCQNMGLFCEPVSGYDPELNIPFDAFFLNPNPSNRQVRLEYVLREKAQVTIELYDAQGHFLEQLKQGEQTPGAYALEWENPALSSGMYWWKFQVTTERGTLSTTRKMVLQY
ncbi:MAG: endonuclease [Saprospirales bacterium]|nr:endonuclease [Saprospirales bacterium]MBK8489406.1 endonuclease [Saprospirales bacterium]